MDKLLIILPALPFPERLNGFNIRYYSILKMLSKRYILDGIVILSEGKVDDVALAEVSGFFHSLEIIDDTEKSISSRRRLHAVASFLNPFSIPHAMFSYHAKENAKYIYDRFQEHSYHRIIFATAKNAHELRYLLKMGLPGNRVCIDFIDSLSLIKSRYVSNFNILELLDFYKIRRWELWLLSVCGSSAYISNKDKEHVQRYLNKDIDIKVAPNGIKINDYHTRSIDESVLSIGFLGNMSYPPNITGAKWVFEVFKEYKSQYGDLKYYIIGRDPVTEIKELALHDGVMVTGTVDDIWEYVNTVDVFIIPLFEGAGQQNKLLEVMYAGRPVIANEVANAGVQGGDQKHLMLIESKNSCLRALAHLLSNIETRESLGSAGKQFVEDKYSWDVSFEKYLDFING